MSRRLVHLNALRAFEAAARLGSFVGAAGELGVTPAAVGQQVRLLEDYFGSPLFERDGRKLILTDAARSVLPEIKDAFDTLAVDATAPVYLAIGPEGGWSDLDREQLRAAGFHGLRLGPRILRTETAGLAAIAALQARFGDLA